MNSLELIDRPRHKFVDRMVREGTWTLEIVPADVAGLTRALRVYRAQRKANLIVHDEHGDDETHCPSRWSDLRIGSGPCGLGCRGCFLMLTHRAMRDPLCPIIYDNVEAFWQEAHDWLANRLREADESLGLGLDCSDSLLYEGITGHARHLIPMFADPKRNPKRNLLVLVTKSTNIHYLEGLPVDNVAITFSLNPEPVADLWEGKWPDTLERITPAIGDRLRACLRAQQMGFETRWRIDPILAPSGWKAMYRDFFAEAAGMGLRPARITLGTYREKNSQLDTWRDKWGLPPMEWESPDMIHQGTHYRLPSALTGAIADGDDQVRQQILRALGAFDIFASEELIDVLSRATEDPDRDVRSTAVATLEAYGSRFPLPTARALARVISAPGVHDEKLTQQAINGLRACGPDAVSDVVDALAARLRDTRIPSSIQTAICDVLGWLGPDGRQATDTLVELVLDQKAEADTGVRIAAAKALIQVEYLPDMLPGRSLSEDRRRQVLSLLRQVGPDATDARRTLEASWREDQAPITPATDSPSPTVAATDSSAGAAPDRLAAIESGIADLHKRFESQQAGPVEKEWYTTNEVAEQTEFAEWTIRNACKKGRIKAEKRPDGKWRISRDELVKIQNEGLPK